jgi:hypothetical protein
MELNARMLAAVSAICYALGMFWLQNMWGAIESERTARAEMQLSIAETYANKEMIGVIAAGREKQLLAITDLIKQSTERIMSIESTLREESRARSELMSEVRSLKVLVDQLDKGHISPGRIGGQTQ